MAMNEFGAGFKLYAQDMASPVFNRTAANFGAAAKKMQGAAARTGEAFGAMAIGAGALKLGKGMAGGMIELANTAGQFEQKMAGVSAITRATGEEFKMLEDRALSLAMVTQFSPEEAAEGLISLGAAGLNAKESATALEGALDLAAGSLGQLNVQGASEAIVGTMKAFGMETTSWMSEYGEEISNSTIVTDKLLKITQLTNFQARDFGMGLSRAASTAGLFGQSLDDTLITMGLLRNLNIEASVGSTSLREAWRRLAADQRSQQMVQKAGVDIFDKSTKKIRPMLDVMLDLADATKDYNDKDRMFLSQKTFGIRGMAAFAAVTNAQKTVMIGAAETTLKGADAVRWMRMEMLHKEDADYKVKLSAAAAAMGISEEEAALLGATDAATVFREKLLDTFEGQKTLIDGAKKGLATVLGGAATKLFKPLARVIFLAYSNLAQFFKAIPMSARKVLIGIVTGFGTLVTMIGGLFVLRGIMSMLGVSIGTLILSMVKFALVLAPLTILVGGLAVSAYAAYRAFSKNTDGIGTSWQDMVKKIKVGWEIIVAVIGGDKIGRKLRRKIKKTGMEGFLESFRAFKERMVAMWEGIKIGFDRGVDALSKSDAFKRLKESIQGVIDLFTGPAAQNTPEALADWGKKGEGVGEKLAKFGEIALNATTHVIEFGKSAAEWLGNLTADDVMHGLTTMVDLFKDIWYVTKKIAAVLKMMGGILYTIIGFIVDVVKGMTESIGATIQLATADTMEEKGAALKRMQEFSNKSMTEHLSNAVAGGRMYTSGAASLFNMADTGQTLERKDKLLQGMKAIRSGDGMSVADRQLAINTAQSVVDEINRDVKYGEKTDEQNRKLAKAIRDAIGEVRLDVKVDATDMNSALARNRSETEDEYLDDEVSIMDF